MKLTKEQVLHIAELAKLELTEKELDEYTGQLDEILSYADKIGEIDTENIVPTSHVLPLKNVTRQDKTAPSLPMEEVLAGAPDRIDGFFKVPKIIE